MAEEIEVEVAADSTAEAAATAAELTEELNEEIPEAVKKPTIGDRIKGFLGKIRGAIPPPRKIVLVQKTDRIYRCRVSTFWGDFKRKAVARLIAQSADLNLNEFMFVKVCDTQYDLVAGDGSVVTSAVMAV